MGGSSSDTASITSSYVEIPDVHVTVERGLPAPANDRQAVEIPDAHGAGEHGSSAPANIYPAVEMPADHAAGEPRSPAPTIKPQASSPADPTTLEGQRKGAILMVKRQSSRFGHSKLAVVGDLVTVVAHFSVLDAGIKSIRTGLTGVLEWDQVLPVPYDGKCSCITQGCPCIYETFEEFSRRCPTKAAEFQKNAAAGKKEPSSAFKPSATKQQQATPIEAADPMTLAGQTAGAILQVKQKPYRPNGFGPVLHVDVGDFVKYISSVDDEWGKVLVKNVRTQKGGYLRWESFKPVNMRTMCSCRLKYCYCAYEDHKASEKYCGAKPAS
ncbi:hypothetical protein CJF32_00005596 [Rutstroemia sp. NJR-2017a WRK4]|nr:hypothetical protein CJF32_00005596 [Rutstroemia sp. NJR-2017a WRK4]